MKDNKLFHGLMRMPWERQAMGYGRAGTFGAQICLLFTARVRSTCILEFDEFEEVGVSESAAVFEFEVL